MRPRSVCLLRRTQEPRRLVRRMRPHRLQLPIRPLPSRLLVSSVPALALSAPVSIAVDCSDFAYRLPIPATMISKPFGSMRRATARGRPAMPTRLTICDSAGRGLRPLDFTVALGGNMQACLKAAVVLCALSAGARGYGFDLTSCFGFCGGPACGCGNPNCCDGCEPGITLPPPVAPMS